MGSKSESQPKNNSYRKNKIEPYLYLIPALLFLFLFTFWPFIRTVILSFFRVTRQGVVREFVGFENYLDILTDPTFLTALRNSILFSIIATPISVGIGLALALLARKKTKTSALYETMFTLTMAVSTSVAAMIFQLMFNPNLGILNHWLKLDINWLGDPKIAMWSLMIIWIWMNIGYNFIFSLAGVRGVDKEVLESAELDGANGWRQFTKIILPSISPTLFFLITTSFTGNMMMNALVLILTQGGPRDSTQTIMYYMISEGVQNSNLNVGYASSVIIFLIISVIMAGLFKLLERKVFYR